MATIKRKVLVPTQSTTTLIHANAKIAAEGALAYQTAAILSNGILRIHELRGEKIMSIGKVAWALGETAGLLSKGCRESLEKGMK